MFAGCGTKGGTDDEDHHTASSQGTRGDLPVVQGFGLSSDLCFQGGDLLLSFKKNRISTFGEEACVGCGSEQQQAQQSDNVFHWDWGK